MGIIIPWVLGSECRDLAGDMYTVLCLAAVLLCGVQGKHFQQQQYGGADVNRLSHTLSNIQEAITRLNYKLHQMENFNTPQHQYGQQYPQQYRQQYPQQYGQQYRQHVGQTEHYGHTSEDVIRVAHDIGLHKVDWGYATPFQHSHEHVTVKDTNEEREAFGMAKFLYVKGAASGSKPTVAPHDQVITHIAGGEVAFHMIHEDGTYEHVILGDVEHNHNARYVVIVPANTYVAEELLCEEYSLASVVSAPNNKEEDYKHPTEEELITKFPQHEDVIRKAYRFTENDNHSELKYAVEHAFQTTQAPTYNQQYRPYNNYYRY